MDYNPDQYSSIWDNHGESVNNNQLMLIARQAALLVPEVKQYLKPETIKALNTYEGVRNDYWASVYDAVEGYLNSSQPITSFRNSFYNAMNSAFQTAAEYGYADGGGEVPLDDKAQSWLDGMIAGEKANITALFQTLKDKRGDVDAINEAFARAEGYSSTLDSIYSQAMMWGAKNPVLTWHLGQTEKHCATCAKLDGKKHRASWFMDRGYIPKQPGASMECGGYNCDCTLTDKDGNEYTI